MQQPRIRGALSDQAGLGEGNAIFFLQDVECGAIEELRSSSFCHEHRPVSGQLQSISERDKNIPGGSRSIPSGHVNGFRRLRLRACVTTRNGSRIITRG